MKIRLINHSSFILNHNGINILCDFWNDGRIFYDSWKLLSEFKFDYNNFENIDFIWFSHAHPDHFHVPSIEQIPLKFRKKIKILTRKNDDSNYIVKVCKKLKFLKVIELYDLEKFTFINGFSIQMSSHFSGDSWCLLECDELKILNINDCNFQDKYQISQLKNKIGSVDYLFAKYSFGSWPGNKDDLHRIKFTKQKKLKHLHNLCTILKPKKFFPFASNIVFVHEDNYYINKYSIKHEEIIMFFEKFFNKTEVLILYPNDQIDLSLNELWNNYRSLNLYATDINKISTIDLTKRDHIPFENLIKILSSKITESNELDFASYSLFLEEENISLLIRSSFHYEIVNIDRDLCDVTLTNEQFYKCLCHNNGAENLRISGLLKENKYGNIDNFFLFYRLDEED